MEKQESGLMGEHAQSPIEYSDIRSAWGSCSKGVVSSLSFLMQCEELSSNSTHTKFLTSTLDLTPPPLFFVINMIAFSPALS